MHHHHLRKKLREIKIPFADTQTVIATDLLIPEDVQALISRPK